MKSDRFHQLLGLSLHLAQAVNLAVGSGLGLYLTRQIIEAHGGTIWAENRKPQGTLFGFKLPALSAS